jgi:hypothetical protein
MMTTPSTPSTTTTSTIAPSFVRTLVPLTLSFLAVAFGKVGLKVTATPTEVAALTSGIAYGYYAVVRLLEEHVSPAWGWLLGIATSPSYTKA